MPDGGRRAVRLVATGAVQGVGYRAFVEREARALGLSGWVRNRQDGSVEAVAIGPDAAVVALIAACRRGPAAGKVAGVAVSTYPGETPTGFTVLPSL